MSPETWRGHFARHGRDYVITGTIAVVIVFSVSSLLSFGRDFYLRQQDPTEWFEYYEISYIGAEPEGRAGLGSLRMQSDMTVRRPVELRFHDVLRCRNIGEDGPREFVSQNPNTGSFVAVPYERRFRQWLYNGDYLTRRDCIVQSTIVGVVDGVTKSQTIDSAPFVIKPIS